METVVRVEFVLDGDYGDREIEKTLDVALRSVEDDERVLSYRILTEAAYVRGALRT